MSPRSFFKLASLPVFVLLISIGCAHHRDVRPGADGVHRVLLRGPDREPLEQDAISQANHYCEQFKKSPAFVNEDSKYTGSGNESHHKMTRGASKAITAGGGMASVFGGANERNAGQVATGAGIMGGIMTDHEAYTVDMRFKCL